MEITMEKDTKIAESKFKKWFERHYWDIAGKFSLPTKEELEQLAEDAFSKLT